MDAPVPLDSASDDGGVTREEKPLCQGGGLEIRLRLRLLVVLAIMAAVLGFALCFLGLFEAS